MPARVVCVPCRVEKWLWMTIGHAAAAIRFMWNVLKVPHCAPQDMHAEGQNRLTSDVIYSA